VLSVLSQVLTWPVDGAAAGVLTADARPVVAGDGDRPFALASVTKLLTALATLVAVEEGSLGLDDPVEVPPGATVRQLLCHASGLAFDQHVALAAPGTRRTYSNTGYEVLADVVAARTGIRFATYLHEAVLLPLGMANTRLDGSPAAAAVSTVEDLLRFAVALREPRLVSPETLQAMATVQYPDLAGVLPGYGGQRPNPWGLGPEIRGHKHPHWTGSTNAPSTFGHFGRAGTFLWHDPDARLTLVVLTDRPFDEFSVATWPVFSDAVLDAAASRP
jgi:CubicO group peptidase (beta-lactamase class C family)